MRRGAELELAWIPMIHEMVEILPWSLRSVAGAPKIQRGRKKPATPVGMTENPRARPASEGGRYEGGEKKRGHDLSCPYWRRDCKEGEKTLAGRGKTSRKGGRIRGGRGWCTGRGDKVRGDLSLRSGILAGASERRRLHPTIQEPRRGARLPNVR